MRRSNGIPKILFPLSLLLLFGCEDQNPVLPGTEVYRQMTIVPEQICVTAGQSMQLMALLEDVRGSMFPAPPGDAVAWQSSASEVATVTVEGIVLAVANGETLIEARYEGFYASATVRVCSDPCASGR